MTKPAKPSIPLMVAVVLSLLVTVACTLLPALNGPATAVDEVAVGLVPAALVLLVTHVLHLRRRVAAGLPTRGWVGGVAVALVAAGVIAGVTAQDAASSARSRARSVRSPSSFSGYGGYDEAAEAQRKARHFESALQLGAAMVGLGVVLGIAGAFAGRPNELPVPE